MIDPQEAGCLSLDPIPSWSIQAALDRLVDEGKIETGTRNRGQTWLAEKVGVAPQTVRRWVSGERSCSGVYARVVREELLLALGMVPLKLHEITGLHMEAPEGREE